MNIINQILELIAVTVTTLLPELGKAAFTVKSAFDSAKEAIIASGLGVPVLVVSIGSVVISIGSFVIKKIF